jgi:hypothetical protein
MYDHGPHIVQKSGRDSWNGNPGVARFFQRQGAYLVKIDKRASIRILVLRIKLELQTGSSRHIDLMALSTGRHMGSRSVTKMPSYWRAGIQCVIWS